MDSTPPSKDNVWQNGLKRNTWQSIVYRRPVLFDRNKHWLRVKGWKIYQAKDPWKDAGIAILVSGKVDFKLTLVKQDKEGLFILVKGEIHQKEIAIINLYVPNVNASSFIKHTLKDLKADIDSYTVIVGDFNTPLSNR
jgi:hypothetical protein